MKITNLDLFNEININKDFITLAKLFNFIDGHTLNKALIYKQNLQDYGLDEKVEKEIIKEVYKNYLNKKSNMFSNDIVNEIKYRANEALNGVRRKNANLSK